jgi:hypothetical protein
MIVIETLCKIMNSVEDSKITVNEKKLQIKNMKNLKLDENAFSEEEQLFKGITT